jgi:hypothetical protein
MILKKCAIAGRVGAPSIRCCDLRALTKLATEAGWIKIN